MKSTKGRSRNYSANAQTGGKDKRKSSGYSKRKRSEETSSDYVKSGNTYSRNKNAGKRSYSSGDSKGDKPFKSFRKRDEGGVERSDSRKRSYSSRDSQGDKPFKSYRQRDEGGFEKSDSRKRSYSSRDSQGDKPFKSFRKRDDEGGFERSDSRKRSYTPRDSQGDRPFKSYRKRDEDGGFEKSDSRKRSYSSRDSQGDKPFKSYRKRDEGGVEKSDSRKRSYTSRDSQGDKPFKSFRKRDDEGSFERSDSRKRSYNKNTDRNFSKGKRSESSERYNNFSDNEDSYADSDKPRKSTFRSAGKNRLLKGKRKKDSTSEALLPLAEGPIRLNRYVANSGICSRREADEMIGAGLISVNGEIVTQLGTKVSLDDVVKYNGETIRNEKPQYLLLNKPKDYITTMDDPQERRTVMSLIAGACKERIYPVGRLDRNTTGVLLFTNDGDLAKKLTHPSYEVQKIYHVELDQNLKPADMEAIREGVKLEDGMAIVDDIQYDAGFQDKSQVGVEIHSGRNRIVRRIFESLGYNVIKLDRVMFAGLTKKDVTRGRWRLLSDMEVNNLKMITARVNKKKEKRPRLRK